VNLIARAKNILLTPKTEWDVIAGETNVPATLVVGYVLPLAALAAIAGFVSSAVIGTSLPFGGHFRMPMTWALAMVIYHLVMSVVACFVVGFIIDVLAPTFGGTKNFNAAFGVAVFSYTAGWVGQVFHIVPFVGWLIGFLISLYGIYLLYLGLPRVMKSPQDKSVGYTALVIVIAIVVGVVIAMVGGMITAPAMVAGMSMSRDRPHVTYDKDSKLGKLEEFAKKMEAAGKKMEEAQKSGDPNKQMEAAMATLGTAISGGKAVEPVQVDVLKPLLPETAAGLPKTSSSADRTGVAGLTVAKAASVYGDQGREIQLEVVDSGGVAGLTAFAAWAALGVQTEKETDSKIERTRREGNRLMHEEISKRGGPNSFTVVLADRFVITARGQGVGIDALKATVASMDLAKLEAMK
jgi:hypothetical protein